MAASTRQVDFIIDLLDEKYLVKGDPGLSCFGYPTHRDGIRGLDREQASRYISLLTGRATPWGDPWAALDWLIRDAFPAALTVAGLDDHAAALRGLSRLDGAEAARAAREPVLAARDTVQDAKERVTYPDFGPENQRRSECLSRVAQAVARLDRPAEMLAARRRLDEAMYEADPHRSTAWEAGQMLDVFGVTQAIEAACGQARPYDDRREQRRHRSTRPPRRTETRVHRHRGDRPRPRRA